jgi:hypothetical protein
MSISNINLNTEFLKNIRSNFKPSLLTRLLLNGGTSNTTNDNIMQGGAQDAKYFVKYEINPDLELGEFIDQWMSRVLVKIFIFTIALYLAFQTVGSEGIRGRLFKNVNMDPSTETDSSPDADFKGKYVKIMLITFILIMFTTVYNFILSKIPYIFIYIYFYYNRKVGDDVTFLANTTFELTFDKFPSKQGFGDLKFYDSMQRYATLGVFLYFLVYFFLVKSFITTLRYPNYTGAEETEFPVEKKFLIFYTLTVMSVLLFMVGLFVAHFTYKDVVTISYMILIVALYALFVNFLYSYQLKKQKIKMMVFFFVLLLIVVFNSHILRNG